jgi:alkylhydroperoxidase family enzyme
MTELPALPPGSWHYPAGSRIDLAPVAKQTLLQKLLLTMTRRQAKADHDLNVFKALARLGGIFMPYLLFLRQILTKGRISRADKERIILRVAWRVGCVYEWGHHVHMAAELGIRNEEIRSLAQPESASWDRRLRTFVEAADELVDQRLLSDETWGQLREQLSDDQAVEFCMLVGHYVMVAGDHQFGRSVPRTELPEGHHVNFLRGPGPAARRVGLASSPRLRWLGDAKPRS